MNPQSLLLILIVLVSFGFVLSRILDYLNLKNMKEVVPDALKDLYDEEEYKRSQQYQREKSRVGLWQSLIGFLVIMAMLILGGFAWLDTWIAGFVSKSLWHSLLFFAALGLGSAVLSLPFGVYNTFVTEERYGFNRTTAKTFILDLLKSALLAVILGGGILALVIWIFDVSGQWFWLLAWGVLTLFSLVMSLLYSDIIVPLFNKQEPLPDGELREAIMGYAAQVDFSLKDIYVMDGSKRSSKANAYFTGFGPRRRIVLFDTLIEEHTTEELVAVLAHEAGHYKRKHVMKGMILSILQSGLMLFILSLFISPDTESARMMAASIGTLPSFHIGIIVFGILYSPLSTLTGLAMNAFARKNEYEADHFAATTYAAAPLADALKRLSVKHLSNLTPHPLYVAFNYSHPTLLQRLEALSAPADKHQDS